MQTNAIACQSNEKTISELNAIREGRVRMCKEDEFKNVETTKMVLNKKAQFMATEAQSDLPTDDLNEEAPGVRGWNRAVCFSSRLRKTKKNQHLEAEISRLFASKGNPDEEWTEARLRQKGSGIVLKYIEISG